MGEIDGGIYRVGAVRICTLSSYFFLVLCGPLLMVFGLKALLTLNSCPMFTYNGRDAHRNLPAAKLHLPFKREITEILPDRVKTEEDEVRLSSLFPLQPLTVHHHSIPNLLLSQLQTGRSCTSTSPCPWSPRYMGQSLRPPHSSCLKSRLGRTSQNPECRFRHGRRISNAKSSS